MKNYLGLEKIIWLPQGVYMDETNEHVDNILHFIAPGKVVLAWTDDKSDPQYEMSLNAYDALSDSTDTKGKKLEIFKLHIPEPVLISKEESQGVDSVDGTLPMLKSWYGKLPQRPEQYGPLMTLDEEVALPSGQTEQVR